MRTRTSPRILLLLSCFMIGAIPASVFAMEGMWDKLVDPDLVWGEEIISPAKIVEERNGVPVYSKEVVSKTYKVDKIYKSMEGPASLVKFNFLDGPPELIWLISYEATMVDAEVTTDLGNDFMCHSTLDIANTRRYTDRFPTEMFAANGRIFTLAQGQLDVKFPDGFGIPFMSNEKVILISQVLNHNIPDLDIDVRQRIEIKFIRNRDLPEPLTPLVTAGAVAMKLLAGEDGHFGLSAEEVETVEHGPGCLIGENRGNLKYVKMDGHGRSFTTFWKVEPGREVNHTRANDYLQMRRDTRIHYVASHLHPFAESLELRDLTTGKTVYKATTVQAEGKIGLDTVTYYSSEEGIPLHKFHEYEIISVYDNTSGVLQDSMANMILYLHAADMYDFYFKKDR